MAFKRGLSCKHPSSSNEESQDIFLVALLKLKWLWWLFNLFTFSPNLFLFCGPLCPTYLMQAEKGGGS
jgi:hypothetical protein